MSLYLDASVVVPLFVVEPRSALLTEWIASSDQRYIVSDLVVTEVGAVISRFVRKNRFSAAHANLLLAQFDQWRAAAAETLDHLSADIKAAGRLVRIPLPKMLAADAIHLATCQRLGLTLVTHDVTLATIAERERVACILPG